MCIHIIICIFPLSSKGFCPKTSQQYHIFTKFVKHPQRGRSSDLSFPWTTDRPRDQWSKWSSSHQGRWEISTRFQTTLSLNFQDHQMEFLLKNVTISLSPQNEDFCKKKTGKNFQEFRKATKSQDCSSVVIFILSLLYLFVSFIYSFIYLFVYPINLLVSYLNYFST